MQKINPSVEKLIIEYCKSKLPIEACGYLAENQSKKISFYPMVNRDNSPTSFQFDPEEQFNTMRKIRQSNESIIGVFHSHPAGKAYPSLKDVELANPDYVQMIIVPECGECSYFRIINGVIHRSYLSLDTKRANPHGFAQ